MAAHKGAAVMTPESLAAHMASQFASPMKSERLESQAIVSTPFALESEDVVLGPQRPSRKKPAQCGTTAATPTYPAPTQAPIPIPIPTILVEYLAALADGTTMRVPEQATFVRVDGEMLVMGFPIGGQRLKPSRGTSIRVDTMGRQFECFSPGIHTDLPNLNTSLSVLLITPAISSE